jgi:hypothetical protein
MQTEASRRPTEVGVKTWQNHGAAADFEVLLGAGGGTQSFK